MAATITRIALTRQPNDEMVVAGELMPVLRASIGGNATIGFYLQFRGDPDAVVAMLQQITEVARVALPAGKYKDESTGPPTFTCPRCARTSSNPTDVQQGYCGNCHDWTGRDA